MTRVGHSEKVIDEWAEGRRSERKANDRERERGERRAAGRKAGRKKERDRGEEKRASEWLSRKYDGISRGMNSELCVGQMRGHEN